MVYLREKKDINDWSKSTTATSSGYGSTFSLIMMVITMIYQNLKLFDDKIRIS